MLLALGLTGLAALPSAGWAASQGHAPHQGRAQHDAARGAPHAVPRSGMSLDQAVQMVQERFNARVVRAETRTDNGRTVHHLRLMNSEGKVWTVRVDAQSGAVR